MEQSLEWSTGFSPLGVNHLRRSKDEIKGLKNFLRSFLEWNGAL